jgi:hypothetical protein
MRINSVVINGGASPANKLWDIKSPRKGKPSPVFTGISEPIKLSYAFLAGGIFGCAVMNDVLSNKIDKLKRKEAK